MDSDLPKHQAPLYRISNQVIYDVFAASSASQSSHSYSLMISFSLFTAHFPFAVLEFAHVTVDVVW